MRVDIDGQLTVDNLSSHFSQLYCVRAKSAEGSPSCVLAEGISGLTRI